MPKILIGFAEDLKHSGIDKYLVDAAKILCEKDIYPDFLTSRFESSAEDFFKSLGCGLFEIPSLKKPFAQYSAVRKLIREKGYDTVYLNIAEPLNCIALIAAKKEKVKRIIVHSHSAGVDRESALSRNIRKMISAFCRPIINKCATELFSCSDKASEWMFGKKNANKAEIIYNSVDFGKYAFDENARMAKRGELGIENKKVYLFVGNACYQKNVFFMLDVFKKISESDENAVLLIAGVGRLLDEMKKYAAENLKGKAYFLGVRNDIPAIMAASDALLLPSRFEGLPFVAIEAQVSGLMTFASDSISKQTEISDRIFFLPTVDPSLWAEKILSAEQKNRNDIKFEKSAENFDIFAKKEKITKIFKD